MNAKRFVIGFIVVWGVFLAWRSFNNKIKQPKTVANKVLGTAPDRTPVDLFKNHKQVDLKHCFTYFPNRPALKMKSELVSKLVYPFRTDKELNIQEIQLTTNEAVKWVDGGCGEFGIELTIGPVKDLKKTELNHKTVAKYLSLPIFTPRGDHFVGLFQNNLKMDSWKNPSSASYRCNPGTCYVDFSNNSLKIKYSWRAAQAHWDQIREMKERLLKFNPEELKETPEKEDDDEGRDS